MAKILVTGSSSSQCSKSSNARNLRFGGLLEKALSDAGHQVDFMPPSVKMTEEEVSQYDSVIVGLAPLTSISSHYMYGALSVLGHAMNAGNASTFVDAPEPHTVFSSLRSCAKSEKELFKDFFSSRAQSCDAREKKHYEHILKTARRLSKCDERLKVIAPSLLWSSDASFSSHGIDLGDLNFSFDFVNLDSYLVKLDDFSGYFSDEKQVWLADNKKNAWVRKNLSLVSHPVKNVENKYATRDEVMNDMKGSLGYFLPVYKYDKPWWSQNLANALMSGVPVFTDWKLSQDIDYSWSVLPHSVEDMSRQERIELSIRQFDSYFYGIPDEEEASKILEKILFN